MGVVRYYDQTIHRVAYSTHISLRLQPYLFYNCCVAAVNEAGRGNSSCQTIITNEAGELKIHVQANYTIIIHIHVAPTAPPTNIEAHQLNSTSVFLLWRPPLAEYRNGVIQSYYVKFIEVNSTEADFQYTTQDQHLLIDNLHPDVMYTCRVAAYTVGRGPYSELFMIILNSESGMSNIINTFM